MSVVVLFDDSCDNLFGRFRFNFFTTRRQPTMDWIAITFWAYTLVVFLIGISSFLSSKDTKRDFFLADRGLGAWVAGLSGAASVESGWVTMGLVGKGFKDGIGVYWLVPATGLSFAFIWFVLAPRISKLADQQQSVTLIDILAGSRRNLLSRDIRLLAVCISVAMLTLYVAAQLSSAGKMFTAAFGWQFYFGVLIGLAITLIYTITGGFRAVAWTDVIQAVLMIFAMVVVPLILVMQLGGFTSFTQAIADVPQAGFQQWDAGNPWADDSSGLPWLVFFTIVLGVPLGNMGQPHLAVRLMAAKDKRAIFRGGVISVIWVMVLFAGAITLGIATRLLIEAEVIPPIDDPEHALLVIATSAQLIPGWLGGLMVAAALAAICSTVDSQLLVSASSVSSDVLDNDAFRSQARSEKLVWWIDRSVVAVVAAIATAFGLWNNDSIFNFVLSYGFAGLGAAFGPALVFRIWRSEKSGDAAVLASMIGGFLTVVVWNLMGWKIYSYNLPPAILVAFLSGLLFVGRSEAVDAADSAANSASSIGDPV